MIPIVPLYSCQISIQHIATAKSELLVSREDGNSSGGLDVVHSGLGYAEVPRVFLLGGDGPPIDLGHHAPGVAALIADVLHSSRTREVVGPGLPRLDVENTSRGVGGVRLDLDDSIGQSGDSHWLENG